MKWQRAVAAVVTWSGFVGRSASGRTTRRARRRDCILGIGLGILGTLFAEGQCVGQAYLRLPDPHKMARPTQTTRAGAFTVNSLLGTPEFGEASVYVPPACVGARPCPLFIVVNGGGADPEELPMKYLRPGADRFGIIMLGTESPQAHEDTVLAYAERGQPHPEFEHFKTEFQYVLTHFAIDLDKIAIMGRCRTGLEVGLWAPPNSDLFSRVIQNSTGWWLHPRLPVDSANKTTEMLVVSGMEESPALSDITYAQAMRREGHLAKQVVGLRGHEHQVEDYYAIMYWLHESWATPNPAARPAPAVLGGLPRLTVKAVNKMTAFWTAFQREPDSIKKDARRAHLREVAMPTPAEAPVSIWMANMAALAARYPSVAADLKQAGLTARAHDAYRLALATTQYIWPATQVNDFHGMATGAQILVKAVAANSILEKNLEFMRAHPDELEALEKTKMWETP